MASDIIRLICPNLRCRSILSVPGHARGKSVRCRQCGQRVRVPEPSAIASVSPKPVDDAKPQDQTQE